MIGAEPESMRKFRPIAEVSRSSAFGVTRSGNEANREPPAEHPEHRGRADDIQRLVSSIRFLIGFIMIAQIHIPTFGPIRNAGRGHRDMVATGRDPGLVVGEVRG